MAAHRPGVGSVLVSVVVAALVAGCASGGSETAGTPGITDVQFGAATPRPSQSIAAAQIDTLLGEGFGRKLTAADLEAAYQAQTQALEVSRPGTAVTWSNPSSGNSGEIVPGATYIVNSTECRDFVHTVRGADGAGVGRGTACRSEDGTWKSII